MHSVSDLYKSILADPGHEKEIKLIIAGVEYGMSKIVSCSISGGVFSTPSIGGTASRQIALEIFPQGTIPRQAKIEVYVRLTLGEQVSEWVEKGVFYFATRKLDKLTGVLTVSGYDAMLKSEQVWLTTDYADVDFPLAQSEAVGDIAKRMGVEVDSRTALSSEYPVDYPVDENGDLTMREVLGYIAVSNHGNWVITDEGKLRLLAYGDAPAETNYLVEENGDAITFGGVRILVG